MTTQLNPVAAATVAAVVQGDNAHKGLEQELVKNKGQFDISNGKQQDQFSKDAQGWAASHPKESGSSLMSSFLGHEAHDLHLSGNDQSQLKDFLTTGVYGETPPSGGFYANGGGENPVYKAPEAVTKRYG